MSNQDVLNRVREEIAKIISTEYCQLACKIEYKDCLKCSAWEVAKSLADQILSIKGVLIESEHPDVPEIPEFGYDPEEYRPYLKRGAINYSKLLSGFCKVFKAKEA